ncbi:MAG: DUF1848 domain-containing protein [Chitinispirillaceae bacterium]|nr:DUF1848 domain-containing protein [Chitinispirillaceae bacterium]
MGRVEGIFNNTMSSLSRAMITTDSGERRPAIVPVIVSASRATDIPAFFGEWLLRRLSAGYLRWINPWNGTSQYVSLEHTRLFVFWSKNPRPIVPVLDELDRRGISYLFQFTLNDYEQEGLEPCVPLIDERIETFRMLAGRLGPERLLWRFDPLLLTERLGPEELLGRIEHIGSALCGSTGRLTISFIARYAKVVRNLRNAGITMREWDTASQEEMLRGIAALSRKWNIPAVTCAAERDFSGYGIEKGKCIDDALLARIFPHDRSLQRYLEKENGKKDPGQRSHCRCIRSKDIGGYNSCGHGCVYCYANVSPECAGERRKKAALHGDAICGYSSTPSSAGTAGSSVS